MKHCSKILLLCLLAGLNLTSSDCGKKKKSTDSHVQPKMYTLAAEVDSGIWGGPGSGTWQWLQGDTVRYVYGLEAGSSDLSVVLDGSPAPDSGDIIMDRDHAIKASCNNRTIWKLELDKAVYYCCPAIGDDGTIYVSTGIWMLTQSGELYAVDSSGVVKWFYPLDYNAYSPVIGPDGTIYVEDFMNNVYAVTPAGGLKWKYNDYDNDVIHYDTGQRNPAVGADGTIYVPADGLYAVNPTTGTRIWRFNRPQGGACRQSPVIGPDGTIYVFIHQDQLFAVNPNGTKKWETRLQYENEMSFGTPAIDDDGVIYIGSEGGDAGPHVYAFDSEDGSLKWKYPVPGNRPIRSSPTIGADGTIYVATKCGADRTSRFLAFTSSGDQKWEYVVQSVHLTGDDIYSTPSVGDDGLIYFGAETGYVYALNPDGSLNWKCQLEYGINWSSAAIANNGRLYIGTIAGEHYQGNLYAIRISSTGYGSSPWPRFRHDNKNTGRYGGP